jgi:hypothetical protein
MHKQHTILIFLVMIALVLVLSACSGSSQAAGQVLLNSTNTMKQLKTVHVDMGMTMGINISGLTSPTSGSTPTNSVNITLSGSGDEVFPDQASLKFTTSTGSSAFTLAEILKGNSVYIQNTKSQWYVLDKSAMFGKVNMSDRFSSTSIPDFNKLLQIAEQDAKVTDHGDQSLNGTNLRHITVTLDKNGFEELLKNIGQLNSVTSATQQSLNDLFKSVNGLNTSMDFWIDESTSYLHHMEMKMSFSMDTSNFITPTPGTTKGPSGISLNLDMTMDLSRFNDSSIKIAAPANAIPTSNPGVIFGFGN